MALAYAGIDDLSALPSNAALSGGPGPDDLSAVSSEPLIAGDSHPVSGRVSLYGKADSDRLSATLDVLATAQTYEDNSGAEAGATLGGASDDVLSSTIVVEADRLSFRPLSGCCSDFWRPRLRHDYRQIADFCQRTRVVRHRRYVSRRRRPRHG